MYNIVVGTTVRAKGARASTLSLRRENPNFVCPMCREELPIAKLHVLGLCVSCRHETLPSFIKDFFEFKNGNTSVDEEEC